MSVCVYSVKTCLGLSCTLPKNVHLSNMQSVSCLRAVVKCQYQVPNCSAVRSVLETCKKFGPRCRVHKITPAHIAGLNAVSETVLANSVKAAKAYCRALACIVAWGTHKDLPDDIVLDPSTVARVLVLMDSHLARTDVQEDGVYALSALTNFNRANSAGILQHGGLATLFAAADTHIASENLQNVVCMVLYNVALFCDTGKAALLASRAVDVARRTVEKHTRFHTPHLLLYQLSAV